MLPAAFASNTKPTMTSGRIVRIMPHEVAEDLLVAPLLEVSSTLNEKPKSMARVKNCSAPSKRCAASSSSVRSTAERHEQLGADLVLAAFAVRRGHQRRAIALAMGEYASIALFSSSGCAVVIMKLPTVSSLRSASSSAGSPFSAATGTVDAARWNAPSSGDEDRDDEKNSAHG